MAKKLTDQSVRAAQPRVVTLPDGSTRKTRNSIMDAKESGLELRVHPNGKKTWALRASVGGKDVRLKLGEYGARPLMSLDDARGRALELKVRLRAEGDFRDADQRARDAAEEQRKFTVDNLADDWLKEQAKHLRASTLDLYRQRLDTHIRPRFGKRALDDVSRADVRAALAEIGQKHKRTANAVKQIIASLYRFAQDELERDVNNPASGMKGFAQASRERALSDAEIKTVWEGLEDPEKPPGPVVALALKFALRSAQRAGEIAGMRDCEIDAAERLWMVPGERTKSGRPNAVPLTPELLTLIQQAQALRTPPKDEAGRSLPFPSDAPVFGVTRHALSRGLARLVAKLGTEEEPFARVTPHDLRRTARTLLARERLGVSHDDAERLLSHQIGTALSRTYNVHTYAAEKRRALERLNAELDRIIAGRAVEAPDNVVRLEARG